MRAARKNVLLIVAVAAVTFLLGTEGAFAGAGLSPGSVTFENMVRGGYSERYLTISNPTDEDVSISVSTEGDISSWVKAEPSSFNMSGVSYRIVKIVVRPPASIPNGMYTGNIFVVSRPVSAEASGGNSVSVASIVVGDATIEISDRQMLRFEVERLLLPNTEECRPIMISASVRNTGNVNVTPNFHVEITSRDGGTVLQQYDYTDKPLFPTTAATLAISVPYSLQQFKCIPSGYYTANIKSYAGSSTIDSSSLNFQIHPRGTLTVGGEILELRLPSNVSLGDVAKIEALFKNTGGVPVAAKLNLEVYQGGRLVETLTSDQTEVFIGGVQPLTVYFTPKSGGKHSLVAYAVFEDKKSDVKNADLEVMWPSSYFVAGGAVLLVAAGAAGYYFMRKKRR